MGGRRRHTERTFRRGANSFASSTASEDIKRTVEELRKKGKNVIFNAKLALAAGVDMIVEDAKSRCPVRSGELKESIKAREVKVTGVEEDGILYEISADATNQNGIAYGQFVEFDPRIAKPFLYPAMDACRDTVNKDIKDAIEEAIQRG